MSLPITSYHRPVYENMMSVEQMDSRSEPADETTETPMVDSITIPHITDARGERSPSIESQGGGDFDPFSATQRHRIGLVISHFRSLGRLMDDCIVYGNQAQLTGQGRSFLFRCQNAMIYDSWHSPARNRSRERDFVSYLEQETGLPVVWLPTEALDRFDITWTDISVIRLDDHDVLLESNGTNLYRGGMGAEPHYNGFIAPIQSVDSIEEAREFALRPRPVRDAADDGRDVIRQGDWFFYEPGAGDIAARGPQAVLRTPDAGQTTREDTYLGNHVAEYQGLVFDGTESGEAVGRVLVKGEVEHVNGDHGSVHLDDWCVAANNGLDAESFEQPSGVIRPRGTARSGTTRMD